MSLLHHIDCISLHVPDLDTGLDFYSRALGLELLWRTESSCGLALPGDVAELVLTTATDHATVQFQVASVDTALPEFLQHGGQLVYGPFDIDIGRCAVVRDRWDNEYCLLDMTKGRYAVDEQKNVTQVTQE